MNTLLATVAALAVISHSGVSLPQPVLAGRSDSLVIDLTSTVPGREVTFRITGLGKGSHLSAASISTRADTLLVTTPASLLIPDNVVAESVLIEVQSGEPWLHATPSRSSTTQPLDLWGDQLRVNRAGGHASLWAPVLVTGKRPGQ